MEKKGVLVDYTTSLITIAAFFRLPEFGLTFKSKTRGLGKKTKPKFKACNAVDCMVLHFGINKTDAVIVGQKLVSAELVKGALLFKDDQSEFYISEDFAIDETFVRNNINEAVTTAVHKKLEMNLEVLNEIHLKFGIKPPSTPLPSSTPEENKQQLEEEDSDEIKFIIHDNQTKIRAATIDKLIERLTDIRYTDLTFRKTFLLTYRSFIDPEKLIVKLLDRFHATGSDPETQKNIQFRVTSVIKTWLENYFYDIEDNEKIIDMIFQFISIAKVMIGSPASNVENLLKKKLQTSANLKAQKLQSPILSLEVLIIVLKKSKVNWVALDEGELAKQFSLYEFQLFSQITPTECLNLNWSKHKEKSPNILRMISHFNLTSRWVQYEIVQSLTLEKRVQVLSKFIIIGQKFFELNNFNGLMEILSSINSSPVRRLKITFDVFLLNRELKKNKQKELPSQIHTKLKFLEKIMAHEGNYREYRKQLTTCSESCLPYLGTYLTDLTFIEENPEFLFNNLINFEKRNRIANTIEQIQMKQQLHYTFSANVELQNWIRTNVEVEISDEEIYSTSLKVEPRNPNEAIENMLMEEQKLKEDLKQLQLRVADLECTNGQLQNTVARLNAEIKKWKSLSQTKLQPQLVQVQRSVAGPPVITPIAAKVNNISPSLDNNGNRKHSPAELITPSKKPSMVPSLAIDSLSSPPTQLTTLPSSLSRSNSANAHPSPYTPRPNTPNMPSPTPVVRSQSQNVIQPNQPQQPNNPQPVQPSQRRPPPTRSSTPVNNQPQQRQNPNASNSPNINQPRLNQSQNNPLRQELKREPPQRTNSENITPLSSEQQRQRLDMFRQKVDQKKL